MCKGIFHNIKGAFRMDDVMVNFLYVITGPQKYMQQRLHTVKFSNHNNF